MNFKSWLEYKAASGEEWFYNKKTKRSEPLSVVFIRFGDLPEKNSLNYFSGEYEKGVSVVAAYYDRISKKFILQTGSEELISSIGNISERPVYLVSGFPNGEHGSDGEQLLDRDSIKIIRKLDHSEITTEQDPYMDILGNDIKKANVTFPENGVDLKELRRKTFFILRSMNLPEETNGFISLELVNRGYYFHLVIEPMDSEKESQVYRAKQISYNQLKKILEEPFFFNMDRLGSNRNKDFDKILFRIRNGKIVI